MARKDAVDQAETLAPVDPEFTFTLIVINQFGSYKKGDRISDGADIQAVIDAGNAVNCNRIAR